MQRNGYDCGIFVIRYIEMIMNQLPSSRESDISSKFSSQFLNEFNQDDITKMRYAIRMNFEMYVISLLIVLVFIYPFLPLCRLRKNYLREHSMKYEQPEDSLKLLADYFCLHTEIKQIKKKQMPVHKVVVVSSNRVIIDLTKDT